MGGMGEVTDADNGRSTTQEPGIAPNQAGPRSAAAGTLPPLTTPADLHATITVAAPTPTPKLTASLHAHGEKVPALCQLVKALEDELKVPVWMCIQHDATGAHGPWSTMSPTIADAIRDELSGCKDPRLAVLVHSPGGQATCAYQLGTAFAKRPEGFWCLVPRYAKSAATLMALGASKIIMGPLAEFGPLDAQILNMDREEYMSALDEVQSLERLQKFALDALDSTMNFLGPRTMKKVDTILPLATQFVHGMVQPLFASIDVVHYTQLSRTLKVAEEYAVRLMEPRLGREKAVEIATRLTATYPEHGFVIDLNEIKDIGLPAEEATGSVAAILDQMVPILRQVTAIGRVVSQQST